MPENLIALVSPMLAHASSHTTMSVGSLNPVGTGDDYTITILLNNVWASLILNAYGVCAAIFVLGAFFFTASAGDEQRKSKGKDMMMGAAIGVGVITGAHAIMNTVLFFLN